MILLLLYVPSIQSRHTLDLHAGRGRQSKHDDKEEKERLKQEERQKKKELKQQQELQEKLDKRRRKEMKQQASSLRKVDMVTVWGLLGAGGRKRVGARERSEGLGPGPRRCVASLSNRSNPQTA